MKTTGRITIIALTIGTSLGVGIAATRDDGATDLRTTRASTVHASADALDRRAINATPPPPTCDHRDFTGSADAYERQSATCVEPVVVFYGSPDSVERQSGG